MPKGLWSVDQTGLLKKCKFQKANLRIPFPKQIPQGSSNQNKLFIPVRMVVVFQREYFGKFGMRTAPTNFALNIF